MSGLLIVDGHAYAYRAFYAIRGMRSPGGRGTNAIFGFIRMLGKLRARLAALESQVSSLKSKVGTDDFGVETGDFRLKSVVVWDGGLSGERLAVLPDYKGQRPEMPAELGEQIEGIQEYLAAAGVASVCVPGLEADDVIAGLARRGAASGLGVVVASSDKDFMQLVTLESQVMSPESKVGTEDGGVRRGWIGLLNPNDKSEVVWGAAEVRAKAGVEPEQVVDWLSLVGDAVDNIPGVPGVGAKTAAGLLAEFGSVEGLYGRLGELKSERVREALRGAESVVRRNQGLVRLREDARCGLELAELAERPVDGGRLAELFRRWGFRGMLAELEGAEQGVLI